LLDGLGRIDDLLHAAVDAGMPAIALTDHGTMFGAIEFYGKAKELGIKPIVGCEVYVSDAPLEQRPGPGSKNYHLVLLAENEIGYRNLIKLSTEAHLRGFYRKPRVDHQLLEQHSEGLICLSGCASSELSARILDDNLPAAEELADWYRQVFADRYYLELQYHELDFQPKINQGIVHLSSRLGLPLVATNDVHYVWDRQARTHELLLCIQTQTVMSDPKRMRMETNEFYLKSAEQMQALFGEYPGAISNTLAIAERCNLELVFGRPQLPRYDVPGGQTSEEYLRKLCYEGLERRYPAADTAIRQRLDYELSVILATGFVDYFLLVYDVIHFARSQGIAVGPGRGSAAGSIVAYCLFLTNVDPIKHGLSFERFLNPERVTMPDMDLDFADDRRDEVIRYVTEKYGRERVAQIITFGTIGARAGVRDVGRAMSMSFADTDRVAKLIPFMCSKVSKAKEEVPELQQLYEGDGQIRELLDTVEDLEGVARHASTHAAGVVIARDPLMEHVPLYKVPKNDQVVTQYAMASIEKMGLLKMDFLGLRTLTIIERACAFVKQAHGIDLHPDDVPIDDESVYRLLSTGETFGVFQVDGAGMRKLLRELQPTEFNHIVAVNALYRPGPMEHIPEFVARKKGEKMVTYDHPALEEVLAETYGIVVYQDQVMRLVVNVAGYTMGEADLVRRAMGKKKAEELAKHRTDFIRRAGERGTDAKTAEHLFNIIEPFAGYAFNKAHAAAYALITCQTAYLKANYPREYLAGLLSAEKENAEKVAAALTECRRLGISVLPPDINHSDLDFALEGDGIRFGLCAIKNVGSGAIESILATRQEGGPFTSLEDLCGRFDWSAVNKRVLESLARCGALDSLGIERGRLVANLDRLVSFGQQLHRAAAAGQTSLFGDIQEAAPMLQLAMADAASNEDKLAWEQELLGTYVSPHPLMDAEAKFREAQALLVGEVSSEHDAQRLGVGGMIRSPRSFSTKDGRPMGSFQLADMQTTLEVVVFSRSYEQLQSKITDGAIVVVDGKIDGSDGRLRLLADGVWSPEEAKDRPAPTNNGNGNGKKNGNGHTNGNGQSNGSSNGNGHAVPPPVLAAPSWRLTIEFRRGADRSADINRIEQIYAALQSHSGVDEVEIVLRQGTRLISIPLPNGRMRWCPELEQQLLALIPSDMYHVNPLGQTPSATSAAVGESAGGAA
jgi:DNA polymerase-3 subunit alpha